jgi:hypothetical protein
MAGDDEARLWGSRGGAFGGDCFVNHHDFGEFVEALYAAGAPLVRVVKHSLVATLPPEAAARARLIALYNREVDRFGEEFGGSQTPGHEMTAAEAAAVGQPDAAGEWVVDDLHVVDTGQPELHFWWD